MKPIIIVAIFVVAGVALNQAISSFGGPSQQEEPTLVQKGVMTERQREHSRVYAAYATGQKLPLSLEEGDLDIHIGTPAGGSAQNAPMLTGYSVLKEIVCAADAVVVATTKSQSSQLTEDEEFVFTDYELAIEGVLKEGASISQASHNITLTRPGGFVRLNGRNIRVTDESFKPLEIAQRYVLFLRFLPTTGTYSALNSKSSFKISGNKVLKLTAEPLHNELETGSAADSFMARVRSIVAGGCAEK